MNISHLKKILYDRITNANSKLNSLDISINFYKEIILDLENGKLNVRGKNFLEDKYQFYLTKENLMRGINVLNNDLFILEEQKRIEKAKLKNLTLALSSLKYKQILSPSLMDYIKDILLEEKLSEVEIINIFEKIKIHNSKCQDKTNRISGNDLFLILNMLNQGYEDIVIKDHAKKEKLEMVAKKCLALIEGNPLTKVTEVLNIEEVYNAKDARYIYSLMLKHYQNEIIALVEVLKNPEFYFNIAILQDIKDDYKILYQKYMYVRNLLDNLKDDIYEKETEEVSLDEEETINLYYSTNSYDPNKCYFINDLMALREESLQSVLDLINDFKNGKKSRIKMLSGYHGLFELKSDQIRIVLKLMDNQNYSVMGVFIKKADNDMLN